MLDEWSRQQCIIEEIKINCKIKVKYKINNLNKIAKIKMLSKFKIKFKASKVLKVRKVAIKVIQLEDL